MMPPVAVVSAPPFALGAEVTVKTPLGEMAAPVTKRSVLTLPMTWNAAR